MGSVNFPQIVRWGDARLLVAVDQPEEGTRELRYFIPGEERKSILRSLALSPGSPWYLSVSGKTPPRAKPPINLNTFWGKVLLIILLSTREGGGREKRRPCSSSCLLFLLLLSEGKSKAGAWLFYLRTGGMGGKKRKAVLDQRSGGGGRGGKERRCLPLLFSARHRFLKKNDFPEEEHTPKQTRSLPRAIFVAGGRTEPRRHVLRRRLAGEETHPRPSALRSLRARKRSDWRSSVFPASPPVRKKGKKELVLFARNLHL